MSETRLPRKTFYMLWVDGTPMPLMESVCFSKALARDLAIGVSKRAQRDVFILKATHCTAARTPVDVEVRELNTTDPLEPKEATDVPRQT